MQSTTEQSAAQKKFNELYITSSEIMESHGVSRTAIMIARRTGRLPDPIDIHGKIFVWERDKVTPYLDAWKVILDVRRGSAE